MSGRIGPPFSPPPSLHPAMIAPGRRIEKGFASQGGKLDVEESDVALKRSLSHQDSQRAGVKLAKLIPRSDMKSLY